MVYTRHVPLLADLSNTLIGVLGHGPWPLLPMPLAA